MVIINNMQKQELISNRRIMRGLLFTLMFCSICFVSAQTKVLYGMANFGGAKNSGVIFIYNPTTKIFTKKFDFDYDTTGGYPFGSLMHSSIGKLYGMLYGGANSVNGSLFGYDPTNNVYENKYNFDAVNGSNPYGSLIQTTDALMYGMTNFGGTSNKGVLFSYNEITGTYSKKYNFTDSQPSRSSDRLVQASNGLLFGTSDRSLFAYDPATEIFTTKVNFEPNPDNIISMGYDPSSSLVLAADGLLYGTNFHGGLFGGGVIFSYNPVTDTFAKKIDFKAENGENPYGSLMQASNGLFYGMTRFGGADGNGVLYSYDSVSNIYLKKADLNLQNGYNSYGNLMQAADGLLYGMTSSGGANNLGVLFSFNISTGIYTKEFEFDGVNGSYPFGNLIEVTMQNLSVDNSNEESRIKFYPNPVRDLLYFSENLSNINIADASGKKVKQFTGTRKSADVSKLEKGVYFIVGTEKWGKKASSKFVKE